MTTHQLAKLAEQLFAARERLQEQAASPYHLSLARFMGRLGSRISKPPRIVLLGEFNAGKSTLANALIGAQVLPTSVHANSRVPILAHYSPRPALSYERLDGVQSPVSVSVVREITSGAARMLRVGLPVERLKRFELIDTPGLASGSSCFDEVMMDACRRAHIVVWCTVATQAWKASEQVICRNLPARLRGRGVLAVTHADGVMDDRARRRLMARLNAEVSPLFAGIVLLDAARAEDSGKGARSGPLEQPWIDCGGHELETKLMRCVDEQLEAWRDATVRVLQRQALRLEPKNLPTGTMSVPGMAA